MKKVYLSILGIAALSCGYAQTNIERVGFETRELKEQISVQQEVLTAGKNKKSLEKSAGDTIYKNNFASGLGAVGGYSAWTTSGTNGAVWLADTDGPNGSYSDPIDQKINSTTAANGFVIFDSDLASGTPSSTPPDLTGRLHSPVIDLSSYTGAILSFESRYRHCCNSAFYPIIEVSTDDFTTVTEFNVEVDGINGNDDSGTTKTTINLAGFLSTATNLTNFQFRFVWKNARRYFWQIDDIAIVEGLTNDTEVTSLILNKVFGDNNTIYTNLKEYTSIPLILADLLSVQAIVKNNGSAGVPSNASLSLTVYDDQDNIVAQEVGGSVSASTNKVSIIGDTISFDTNIDLAQLTPGTYKIFADLASGDENTDNDTISRTLVISDNYLGQQNYDIDFIQAGSNGYKPSGNQDYFTVGNEYFFPAINSLAEVAIDGLEITLAQSTTYTTTPNTEVEVKIFEVQSNPTTYVPVDQSRLFDITSDMIPASGQTNTVILNFHHAKDLTGAIYLPTDKKYVVGVYHAGGSQNFSYAVQSLDNDFSSRTYLKSSTTNTDTWFWNGDQFLSRLVFDQTLGLNENNGNVSVGNIYPNPTTGISNISYSLQNASNVTVKVVDVTGKIVYTSNEGQQNSGSHNVNLDATEFNNGVYYVTISTDEEIVTKKLIKK